MALLLKLLLSLNRVAGLVYFITFVFMKKYYPGM